MAHTSSQPHDDAVRWFAAWALIGAAYALALLGAMTIGIFVLPVAVIATVLVVRRRESLVGLFGLVSGAAVPLLYVAYLNRGGPGMVCTRTPTSESCTDEWSPWPWLVAAAVLVMLGVVLFRRRRAAIRP